MTGRLPSSGFKKVLDDDAALVSQAGDSCWSSPSKSTTATPISIHHSSPSTSSHHQLRLNDDQERYAAATPDDSSLQADGDDAPLCSQLVDRSDHTSPRLRVTKKAKSGFRLPTSKKAKKTRLRSSPSPSPHISPPWRKSDFPPPLQSSFSSATGVDENVKKLKNDKSNKGEKKKEKKEKKQKKKVEENVVTGTVEKAAKMKEIPVDSRDGKGLSLRISATKKQKRREKQPLAESSSMDVDICLNTTLFGVPLELALERNPSHDGVPIPAFFRHCIDFIEEYGLATEGVYRVPGVNSQVKMIINALNHGVEFPDIPATLPTSLPSQQAVVSPKPSRHQSGKKLTQEDSTFDRMPSLSIDCGVQQQQEIPSRDDLIMHPDFPPHDPAVVTSVLKHFLRTLPEPLLTSRLTPLAEASCDLGDTVARIRRLGELIHGSEGLPLPNRYLLAWLLQHMTRVIDRCGDNKMTFANLSIVLSPTLGMSHRLLAVLLSTDMGVEGNLLTGITHFKSEQSSCYHREWNPIPHWLFPDNSFAYRRYTPPIPLPPSDGGVCLELPDSAQELEEELFKQESRLAFILKQIVSGQTSSDKESFIWEMRLQSHDDQVIDFDIRPLKRIKIINFLKDRVHWTSKKGMGEAQHLVTKMKRKKALLELTDPAAIRAELGRQELHLDRIRQELAKVKEEVIPPIPPQTSRPFSPTAVLSTSPEAKLVGRATTSRIPNPQFDFSNRSIVSSPPPSLQIPSQSISLLASPTTSGKTSADLDSEFWEVQRTVTLLKRRLKSQLKSPLPSENPTPPFLATPAETLDAEEILNFTLRKPKPFALQTTVKLDETATTANETVNLAAATYETAEEKHEHEREGNQGKSEEENQRDTDLTPELVLFDDFSVDWPSIGGGDNLPISLSSSPQPPISMEEFSTSSQEDEDKNMKQLKEKKEIIIDPTTQHLLSACQYWAGRQQELVGSQNDLKSRIRSQKAEILRIQISIKKLISSDNAHAYRIYKYYRHLLSPSQGLRENIFALSGDSLSSFSLDAVDENHEKKLRDEEEEEEDEKEENEEEEEEDDEEEEGDEVELASTLLQLMRDNARLEALNTSHIKSIMSERDRCAHLKVLLRMSPATSPMALDYFASSSHHG